MRRPDTDIANGLHAGAVEPPRRGFRFSFTTALFLIAILGTIPTLLFSGFLLVRFAQSERDRAERGLIESARGIARGIDSQFLAAEAALLALRDSPFLEKDEFATFEARLRRTAQATGRSFALVGRDGQQIVNTFVAPGQPLPRNDPALWGSVFSTGKPHITNVFEGASSGRLLAAVGVPVMRNGEVRFTLVSGLFAEEFRLLMQERGVPPDWIFSIADRTGRILMRSHSNEQFAGKLLVPELIGYMHKGETGTLRTKSLEGFSLVSTIQYAPRSGWGAAVGLPVATLEAPMRESLRDLIIIGVLVTALAFGLAFLVTRMLNRSVGTLSAMAASAGRGELVAPAPSRISEADAIARVLAQTSRDLHQLTAGLEAQVAARTTELSKANESLKNEIDRRQQSEAQLVQMQKMEAVGQLTGGIAHDFNNMLAIVIGSLQLLQKRLERGETNVQKYVEGALHGAERAAGLTARLLAFSRQQALQPQVIDPNKLLSGMGEILRRTIPESVQIETVLAGGVWRTFADMQGLESAVINLATNARDAMPDGGKLTIETANAHLDERYAAGHPDVKAGQYVMIAVADTGQGMSADVARRAFDPFFTTKPTGQGTGLGLSQVHGFMRQSGGHVTIYSESGQGTTVKLYLPRHFGAAPPSPEKESDGADVPRAPGRETIMVVEDEADVRKLTVEMLQQLGYRTLEAEGAATALALLDANPDIALLLTDVVMPGMNGRQLATEALKRRPGLAVLFTTGYTRNAIVHHGVLDPDVEVILKPHRFETLARKVSEVLGQR